MGKSLPLFVLVALTLVEYSKGSLFAQQEEESIIKISSISCNRGVLQGSSEGPYWFIIYSWKCVKICSIDFNMLMIPIFFHLLIFLVCLVRI